MDSKNIEAISMVKYFNKMKGFDQFQNALERPLEGTSPRKTIAVDNVANLLGDPFIRDQKSYRKISQQTSYIPSAKKKQSIDEVKESKQASENLSTKVQAAKKILTKNPNEKP